MMMVMIKMCVTVDDADHDKFDSSNRGDDDDDDDDHDHHHHPGTFVDEVDNDDDLGCC